MRKGILALVGILAIFATTYYVDVADAFCGRGEARRQARQSSRGAGGCGQSSSMSYSFQMRSSNSAPMPMGTAPRMMFRSGGSCGPGGCN